MMRAMKENRTRRRGNGEGSIYQRTDGTWCATYSAGYNEKGKRKRRTIFGKTKQAVQNKLHKLLSEVATGTPIEPHRMTVGEFLDRWLTGSAKTIVKPTTFVNYEGVIKNHIKPHLGGVPLMKLAVIHIQGLYSAMARDGKSAETIRLTHAVLRRALKQGVRWRLIPYNVCADVDRPRVAKAEIAPLNIEQVAKFLKVVEQDRHSAVFTLAIAAGMRSGELFGLQWHDVDLKAGAIMVTHTLTELHGKWFLTEPKTAKGRRRINLPAMAIEALKKHRSQMLTEGHGNVPWVFCDTQGGPLRRSHFRERVFKPLLKKAGLPNIRFHDLRHTSATLLLSAGVHPKIVQERLGHSQISVTLDTYSHVLPTLQLEAADKLDSILRGGAA
jgi:integrase